MKLQVLAAFAVLLYAADASPGSKSYPACGNDACGRAVQKGPAYQQNAAAQARSECTSYLVTTVTPCPCTSIQTVTSTKTAKTCTTIITEFETAHATVTDDVFKTLTETSTGTKPATATQTLPTTTTEPVTVHSAAPTITMIISTTTTVTSTVTHTFYTIKPNPPGKKRADVDARAYPTCPHAAAGSKIPDYASSACKRAPAAYSSACSCIGATPGAGHWTTTLPAATSTKTKLVRTTITPTLTKTVTVTATTETSTALATKEVTEQETVYVTSTSTRTVYSTVTVTSTLTAAATSTTTTEVTTTVSSTTTTKTVATVTRTATACPIVALDSAIAGKYLSADGGSRFGFYGASKATAPKFYLDASNRLATGGVLLIATDNLPAFVFLDGPAFHLGQNAGEYFSALVCQYSASDELSCTSPGHSAFSYTVSTGSLIFENGQFATQSPGVFSLVRIGFDCT